MSACKKNGPGELENTFTTAPSGAGNYGIQFTSQVSNATGYEWDFGDGMPHSSEPNPLHVYECPGAYSVTLTLIIEGTSSSETEEITVSPLVFRKKFSLPESAYAAAMVRTSDMGYAIFGNTISVSYKPLYFIKTDRAGNKLWDRVFEENLSAGATSMIQAADGGYALLSSRELGSFNMDFHVTKINAQGNTEWERDYGGSSLEFARKIQQAPDGGYVILGSTTDTVAGNNKIYLIKTNATGQVEWERTYGSREDAFSLIATTDGGYAMLGQTKDINNTGKSDVYLLKVNSSGAMEWEKTFGGPLDDQGYALVQAPDGGYMLLGFIEKPELPIYDMYLIKTNQSGEKQWENTYDVQGNEGGVDIKPTPDGGYVLLGYANLGGTTGADVFLVKIDGTGTVQWKKTYGDTTYDSGISIETLSGCDGYVILANQFHSIGLIKTDKDGNTN